ASLAARDPDPSGPRALARLSRCAGTRRAPRAARGRSPPEPLRAMRGKALPARLPGRSLLDTRLRRCDVRLPRLVTSRCRLPRARLPRPPRLSGRAHLPLPGRAAALPHGGVPAAAGACLGGAGQRRPLGQRALRGGSRQPALPLLELAARRVRAGLQPDLLDARAEARARAERAVELVLE